MNRHAVRRHVEIAIALLEALPDMHAQVEELSNAVRVSNARELSEKPSSVRFQLSHKLRFATDGRTGGRPLAARARRDQSLHAIEHDRKSAFLEQVEDILEAKDSDDIQHTPDYVGILRRLWQGETVAYSGPLGEFAQLRLEDVGGVEPPPVLFGTLGQPVDLAQFRAEWQAWQPPEAATAC